MLASKPTDDKQELCPFFVTNGYCTLGKKCKLYHDRTKYRPNDDSKEPEDEDDEDALTEICFSFDTTGSMYSWLTEVRKSISQIVRDLFKKIPNIRISIIAHGDYCDAQMYYVLKYIDFSRDRNKIIKFVNEAGPTGGGDAPECYELVLYEAVNTLSWSPESKSRALVVIGDADPHPPSYGMNTKNINWRTETDKLKKMGVTMYGIYCGYSEPRPFYKEISRVTGGRCLKLNQCSNISQLFMALCLKNSNNRRLFEEYREQLLRHRQCNDELTKAIDSIAGMIKSKMTDHYYHDDTTSNATNRVVIASSVKRLMADLNEIRREKLINISIVPQAEDVFKWHVNVKPLQGALSDIYVHLVLSFPSVYPSSPPKIRLVTKMANGIHPNITDNDVCLPLFGAKDASKSSKYGSSWSAAYSITSLLVNISSIFTEIRKIDGKQIDAMRKCHCRRCGHSNTTPYPPLESNRLPVTVAEYDYNDTEPKKDAKKEKKKTKPNVRGVMIAGNILETVKPCQYWLVKCSQSIKRIDECVAWQFVLQWFDRKDADEKKVQNGKQTEEKDTEEFQSDVIFGLMTGDNIFFGVNIDGFMVYDNKVSTKRIYTHKVKENDVLTYILRLSNQEDGAKDVLAVYVNYKPVGSVSIAPYVFEHEFYPMMYLKDTRVELNLNTNMKLMDTIQDMDNTSAIHFMSKLPQHAPRASSIHNDEWEANEYYKDRESWNRLVERSLSCDILLEVFTYLSYTDWIRCKHICVYWHHVLHEYNVIDRNEMNCFYTKESIDTNPKCILGVGLNVAYSSNNWITSVSTEMDFLSLNSYVDYKIKKGIWGEPITHFLPLVINEKHAALAYPCLMKRIYFLCHETHVEWQPVHQLNEESALLAITAIMNQFVVQLMASCTDHNDNDADSDDKKQQEKTTQSDAPMIDAKHASEKALIGYCAFHHLLLYLSDKYPKIKRLAQYRLKRFITDSTFRHKLHTPDLGKFLLNLAICDGYSWEDLKEAFIAECNVRNVKWYLKKYPHLEYYDSDRCSDKERIQCTLKSTTISRRLVIFQVWFINHIARPSGGSLSDLLESYHKRWGRPTHTQRMKLMKQIKIILAPNKNGYNFQTWMAYFDAVGIKKFKSKQDILVYLRRNIEKSRTRSYHQTNGKICNENRLFTMRYKFNLKRELYQREYITKLRGNKMMIYKNPTQFEGIRIEYHPKTSPHKHLKNGVSLQSESRWVNIYDEATHRWYIGYIMTRRQDATCDVLYVGWNKEFLERNVPLNGGRIAKLHTVPLSVNDKGFKQGFIESTTTTTENSTTGATCVEEYEKKLDLEEKMKNEKAEKIAFYHREFFQSVTDNDIARVGKFLRMDPEPLIIIEKSDDDDDDKKKEEEPEPEPEAETKAKAKTKKKGTRRGKRSGKKKTKNGKKGCREYDAMVSDKCTKRRNKRGTKRKNITAETSFMVTVPKMPPVAEFEKAEAKKAADRKQKEREKNKERLFWSNYNINIDVHMTDAFGRNPLFLSCYMGHIEMTKLLLSHGFSANIEDINGESALDQIVYGKKQKYHDAESMEVYNMVSHSMQNCGTVLNKSIAKKQKKKKKKNGSTETDKYYVYIGGLGDTPLLENEMIDLCELYDIYPNEMILNRGYCIIGVNDADIMKKIYFMDESFFRCSILNVRLYDGNAYSTTNKMEYPSNTLYVCNFDSVQDMERKLMKIFSKYGKLRRNQMVVKQNRMKQNFTFVEYCYVNNAIYAYNDIVVNKHQARFKLNYNANSNRRIAVRFAKNMGGFGGKLGAGGRPRRVNYNNNNENNNDSKQQQKMMKLDVNIAWHLTSSAESVQSALCFIPPQDLWPEIQNIRRHYDPAYTRWMPHINIFFPFVDRRYFDAIASFIEKEIIESINFKSFEVSLERFDVFDHIRNRMGVQSHSKGDKRMETLFLRPNKAAMHQMCHFFEYLKQFWPSYASKHIGGYTPHCTVGKFSVSDLSYYRMQFQSRWNKRKFKWKCDAIYLIAREGNKAFTIRNKISFC